jgi:hypothetical protein
VFATAPLSPAHRIVASALALQRPRAEVRRLGGARRPSAGMRGIPHAVKRVLESPGTSLTAEERSHYEPQFGHDFSRVRIHHGREADDSARAIGAAAYTFGHHVVLGDDVSGPGTSRYGRVLAHELTHVAQGSGLAASHSLPTTVSSSGEPAEVEAADVRSGPHREGMRPRQALTPGALYRWESCDAESCPARDSGEITRSAAAGLRIGNIDGHDPIVYGFPIGSDSIRTLASNPDWAPLWGSLVTGRMRFQILGFSDCEGATELNTVLRWTRAINVNNALPAAARANIDGFSAAPLSDCVASNDTAENRAFNRSVVFHQTSSTVDFADDVIPVHACPPATRAAATSLGEYRSLVTCAEHRMGLGPRDMLAVLRQLYYGKPWSSVSATDKWDNVIPCSPRIGHPEARLGTNLFHALRDSAEVGGVDMGHIWTGLEAMACPSTSVSLVGGLVEVGMSNEDFATWGGDLGAAVAAYVACPQMGSSAATAEDCGRRSGSQPLSFYLAASAPPQDLEGDIAAFVIRAQARGVPCTGSQRGTFVPSRPMGEIILDYYDSPSSPLGAAAANQYRCFTEAIGGVISGRRITNKSTIRGPIAYRVRSFADAFYTKIRGLPHVTDSGDRVHLWTQAEHAVDWFLGWLEVRL